MLKERARNILDTIAATGFNALMVFKPENIFYLTLIVKLSFADYGNRRGEGRAQAAGAAPPCGTRPDRQLYGDGRTWRTGERS